MSGPFLDPFAADGWIRQQLLAWPAVVEFCGDRIHPARDDFTPEGWPYIVFTGDDVFDRWGGVPLLAIGEYSIFAVHREDKCEGDVEDANAPGYQAIFEALQNAGSDGPAGLIHGCEYLRPWKRRYGEVGQKISELGIVARIHST